MNKIIKKLNIPGYETKVIIKPRINTSNKKNDGIQLSFEIEMDQENKLKTRNV